MGTRSSEISNSPVADSATGSGSLQSIASYNDFVASAPVLSSSDGTGSGAALGIANAGTMGSVNSSLAM
jgi:hypothetical protein